MRSDVILFDGLLVPAGRLDFGGELVVAAAANKAQFYAGNGVSKFSAFDEFGGGLSLDLGWGNHGKKEPQKQQQQWFHSGMMMNPKAASFGRSNQGQRNKTTPAEGRVARRGLAGPASGLDIGISIHRRSVLGDVEYDPLDIVEA